MVRFKLDKRRAAAILAAAEWSRRALARRLSIHHGTLSRWLNGRHAIPKDRLEEIAEIVGVPVDAFFGPGGVR